MRYHAIAAGRWLSAHRYQLALSGALVLVSALFVAVAPSLLVISAIEVKRSSKRKRLLAPLLIQELIKAAVWLWQELHDAPHKPWHLCAQCGRPIEEPSRAGYCSHACRSYARLERDANGPRIADRAKRRLRTIRLQKEAAENPDWTEVPF
jgi:hypothetical protein